MQIAEGHAVFFHYKLTSDDGETIDSSEGREPLGYLHGSGAIVPGLEKEMTGKAVGDKFEVKIEAKDGYGEHEPELVQTVPRETFGESAPNLQPGMMFQVQMPEGIQIFTITAVTEKEVRIDGNHALAGANLNFAIEVTEVREATQSEIDHGHPHGDGGGGCCGGDSGDEGGCCG